jgi:peptidoglycan/xylan/chitin deacetylase (PgdA/CDA1 family)
VRKVTRAGRAVTHATRLSKTRTLAAIAGAFQHVEDGKVALTFDDGPHPTSTGRLLDVLAELDVQATFFCVGKNARAHGSLVRRAILEGHAVGSHSLNHPHPTHVGLRALTKEYLQGREAVSAAAGSEVLLFRPPHGHLALGSALMLRRQDLAPWLWTVDPQDWRPGVSTQEILSLASRAGSGDVVLLHDWVEQPWAPEVLDRSPMIDALPGVVRAIREQGLTFTRLS